jgi:hypothetical protein
MEEAMNTLRIEWAHYEKDGVTCARCGDTGRPLKQAVDALRDELAARGIRVSFTETLLAEQDIPQSNAVFFNGMPLEALIPGATASENHCQSCSELTGRDTRCRTVEIDGLLHEALPQALIRQAAFRALGLKDPLPILSDPVEACCTSCA